MAASLADTSPRAVVLEAKEFVWRKRLGNYSVREIAVMLSRHLGRPVGKSTVQRWLDEGEKAAIARTAATVDARRAVELQKLDEMERRVQEVMDATHYALAGGVVVRGLPADGQEVGEPLLDDEPVLKATAAKLKIMERRARFNGWDAEQKIIGDITVRYEVVGVTDLEVLK